MQPLCPNCHKQLPKFPTRKGKCPFCDRTYLVRTDPETKEKVIVDSAGAKRIEKIYHRQAVENELERNLRSVTDDFEGLYKSVKDNLTEKWMPKFGRGPGNNDVLWGVAGRLNLRVAKVGNFHTMSSVYFYQALYIHNLGKDCHYLLKPAKEMDLREYAKTGIKQVTILANQACEECHKLDGMKLTIEEALQKHPIPNPHCTFKLEDSAPTGWCRCLYQPEIESLADLPNSELNKMITFSKPQPQKTKKGLLSRFLAHD